MKLDPTTGNDCIAALFHDRTFQRPYLFVARPAAVSGNGTDNCQVPAAEDDVGPRAISLSCCLLPVQLSEGVCRVRARHSSYLPGFRDGQRMRAAVWHPCRLKPRNHCAAQRS